MTNMEILGPWLHNRGDELMLQSVLRYGKIHGRVGTSSNLGLDQFPAFPDLYKIKSQAPLSSIFGEVLKGNISGSARMVRDGILLRTSTAEEFYSRGWMPEKSLELLLDASGYAYGDPWSLDRTRNRALYYARLKRQGTKIVVLPQAYGPFDEPDKRAAAQDLFIQCDMIFARDLPSRQFIEGLGLPGSPNVPIVPDITTLLEAEIAPASEWSKHVAIVPNARMLDRTSEDISNNYREFLKRMARMIRQNGLEPVLVVHEKNDRDLVTELRQNFEGGCSKVVDEDAMTTKGILGAVRAVVSSRYHACVSSLSQGVPTIATSWHHKYELLFRDYRCEHMLLEPGAGDDILKTAINQFVDPDLYSDLVGELQKQANAQKAQVQKMWTDVDTLLSSQA